MVQVIDTGGSIAGRIGKGFGQGLSEQIPKEVQNYRLASAFEKFGDKENKQTPTQQMASLIRAGGGENLGQLYPLIREAQQRQAYLDKYGNEKNPLPSPQPSTQTGAQPPVTQPSEVPKVSELSHKGLLASPSEIKRYNDSVLQEPSANDINSLASEFIQMGVAPNVPEAQKMAKDQLSQDISAQQTKLATFQKGLDERVTNDLQKAGFDQFQDVAGEIKNALIDQGKYLVGAKGMTPQAAEKEIADIVKELGKTATQTKTTGALSLNPLTWIKPSSEKSRELKDQKKQFEKYGFGEIFDDMASSALGTTPMQTAAILDPLTNKDIDSTISAIKPSKFVDVEKLDPNKMDQIIKSIKPKDNLLSIAEKMRSKKIDVEQFLNRLSELEDEGEIALTAQQIRQRNKPASNSVFGDILFKIF